MFTYIKLVKQKLIQFCSRVFSRSNFKTEVLASIHEIFSTHCRIFFLKLLGGSCEIQILLLDGKY